MFVKGGGIIYSNSLNAFSKSTFAFLFRFLE